MAPSLYDTVALPSRVMMLSPDRATGPPTAPWPGFPCSWILTSPEKAVSLAMAWCVGRVGRRQGDQGADKDEKKRESR